MRKIVSVTSNLIATSVASLLAASLIMSGSWAWQSFNQIVDNKSSGYSGAGGRIHTDFNGDLKNVYVENYKEPLSGETIQYVETRGNSIYVRVRMEEYLELGDMAGLKDENRAAYINDGSIILVGDNDPDIFDSATWQVVEYLGKKSSGDSGEDVEHIVSGLDEARKYVNLYLGGSTIYMPTFNKNDDSRVGIINGTLAGKDGDERDMEGAYDDYVEYSLDPNHPNHQISDTAIYDMDDNDLEESKDDAIKFDPNNPEKEANIYENSEVHTAQETLFTEDIMTISEWSEMKVAYDEYVTALSKYQDDKYYYDIEKKSYDEQLANGEDPDNIKTPEEPIEPKEKKSPVGAYWVYDPDGGWFYWSQPLEPQTATGLLLNRTESISRYDGSWYYEISTRAQYATRGDWGNVHEETGFYEDGVSAAAKVLLQTISGTVIK